ncbi:MAG: 16S rRNA (cytosine(967)-C(5))-methyltransferase RsmB, partial [Clostridia bacterium]
PVGDRPSRPDGERSFGKPSFSKPAFSRPAGDRPAYGKPAGDRPARPDGERSFGKPSFSKPAFSRPAGDRPAFSRPAGDRPTYGKPAGDRPSRPAYGDRPARAEGARGYAKPEAGKSNFSRPSSGKPGFSKPAYVGGHMRTVSRSTYAQEPVESTGLSINARRVALDVLCDVHQNGAYASLTLDDQLRAAKLSPEDRRLVTSIVYGTLENETRIDYALDKLMEHPTQVPVQRDILRMSAYQILFLDRVPDSAAVNEAVKIVKSMDMESASGFINAVLRNLVRGKEEMEWPKREDDLREYLHIMGSMPMWIVDKLIAAYGEEEAERIVMFRDTEHPLVLRPNLARLTDAEFEALLEKKAWRCERALAPHAYFVYGASEITFDRDYIDGLFSIQGQSSMLAAEAVGAKVGMKILDACAAPGGKSAYLCESMQMTGRVYAWELHEKRTLLLEGVKRRLHLDNLRISVRDATEPRDDLDEMLDAVLLDAPCSGLGVMVQKPDIKLRLKEEDIEPIVKQQQKMLETLCRYVKRGGLLVYSTCSILPEENTEQIRAFLEAHPDYQLEALPASYPEVLRAHQQPLGLQLLNYRDGVEGFFIARMRRNR